MPLVRGVGNCETTVINFFPVSRLLSLPPQLAVGVGNISTNSCGLGSLFPSRNFSLRFFPEAERVPIHTPFFSKAFREFVPPSRPFVVAVGHIIPGIQPVEATSINDLGPREWLPLFGALQAVGVGIMCKYPDAFPDVRGSHVVRSQHHPFRIVPDRGQVSEYSSKPARSENWGVFHEDELWSNFANNAEHFPPQSRTFAVDAGAFACRGNVLARKASRYHVNKAAPRSSVKGAYVIPNRARREYAVILAGEQYACGVGIEFDGADGSDAEQFASEYASTSAREKM
ncbi:hypothetical protein O4G19_01585 [Akkermansia muciniphila]|nr:hypothetical protein [Akkermansia muciniphila]WMB15593.1 hypothetical protein O4G22_01565 [Akkermansia muciniphila]WMB20167.1 hypothetical protein O4G19_01585 [Akkermansia muciniphila]